MIREKGAIIPVATPYPLDKEDKGGGEGVQGEGLELPPKWEKLLRDLYAVPGYPAAPEKDVPLLERAASFYGMQLVTDVVSAWVVRRMDDPLRPTSRPRSEIWNWFRKQKQWRDEENARGEEIDP